MTEQQLKPRQGSRRRTGRSTLGRKLYTEIREDILSGQLVPDSKLILEDLCASYGTGMSPLREALSQLAADKLVRTEPQRGFWVAAMSLTDFSDITQTRIELETAALRKAIRLGNDEWEAEILAAHHRLSRHPRKNGAPDADWEARHRAFHLSLVAACASSWTLHFLASLLDQFDRYRRISQTIASKSTGLSVSHEKLSEAVLNGETERAVALLTLHIQETQETVVAALKRHQEIA